MKKLILFFCCSFCLLANAQDITIDNEKLLEYYQTQRYAEAAQYLQNIDEDFLQNSIIEQIKNLLPKSSC